MKELVYSNMKLHILQDLHNWGVPPPITLNINPMMSKKPEKNHYSPKVNIKTHPRKDNSKIIFLYVPIFNTILDESLLKFLVLVNKILKGQNMTTGTQCYMIMKNILSGGSLYKIVVQGLTTQSFPP